MGDFWGIKGGEYTPEYKQAVDNIVNDPEKAAQALEKLKGTGYVNSIDDLKKYAYDGKIGEVHGYIKSLSEQSQIERKTQEPKQNAEQETSFYDKIEKKRNTLPEYSGDLSFKPTDDDETINRAIYNDTMHTLGKKYFGNTPYEQIPKSFFEKVRVNSNQQNFRTGRQTNGQAEEAQGDRKITTRYNPSHFEDALDEIKKSKDGSFYSKL